MVSLRSMTRALLPALLLSALPGALAAQEPAPAPAPGMPGPEVQAWLAELQQLHGRLEAIQEEALEDSALSAAQEELGTSIREAMQSIDPKLDENLSRMQALETEAISAQQAGDQAKLQQLGMEAQQIQQQFVTAQQQALSQPSLAAQLEAFQSQLEAKMREVDPQAEQLIARFQELEQRLAATLGGG